MPGVAAPKMNKDLDNRLVFLPETDGETGKWVGDGHGGDRWQLRVNGEPLRDYTTNDLRVSIVYRGRCFAHAAEATAFRAQLGDNSSGASTASEGGDTGADEGGADSTGAGAEANGRARERAPLELDELLRVFATDLVAKGKVATVAHALDGMPRLELATLIMDTYIKYPFPTADYVVVPFNFCALPRLAPWTKRFLAPLCE
jgi:hypothetical protein